MSVVAVVGGQWGDEGKGKIVDLLAERANLVVRYSGGNNAGHTIMNEYGTFRLHLVPSGVFHKGVTCIIGNGVVIDPQALTEEMDDLRAHGVDLSGLRISDRAHLIMPYHVALDALEEQARGAEAIGTTGKGIGPAFMDKIARNGIRVGDLMDHDSFAKRLSAVLKVKNAIITKVYGGEAIDFDRVYDKYCAFAREMGGYVAETQVLAQEAVRKGDSVLLEGAQGTMLDPDFGTYPFVTSSCPTSAGAALGLGIPPTSLQRIIGVFKAYTTRVGGGPMPTELKDETGELIRERAHEYGATTGRPRRCGWFDAVAARHSARINGLTGIALTRLDVLDGFDTILVCSAYEVEGKRYQYPPASVSILAACRPVYEEVPGWSGCARGSRSMEDLPAGARAYALRLSELIGCPLDVVSVGPEREETITIQPL